MVYPTTFGEATEEMTSLFQNWIPSKYPVFFTVCVKLRQWPFSCTPNAYWRHTQETGTSNAEKWHLNALLLAG